MNGLKGLGWMIAGCGLASLAWANPHFGVHLGTIDFLQWKDGRILKLPACDTKKNRTVREIKLLVEHHKVHVERVKIVTHEGLEFDISVSKNVEVDKEQDWLTVSETPQCISLLRVIENDKGKLAPEPTKAQLSIWGR